MTEREPRCAIGARVASWTPRPVAAPTREAHLATLRAWHADRFSGAPASHTDEGMGVTPQARTAAVSRRLEPSSAPIIVVARADSLVAVDPQTGEVREP